METKALMDMLAEPVIKKISERIDYFQEGLAEKTIGQAKSKSDAVIAYGWILCVPADSTVIESKLFISGIEGTRKTLEQSEMAADLVNSIFSSIVESGSEDKTTEASNE